MNGGWENWSMIEIEKFTCDDSREAHKRERFWVETLNATLNCQVPSRTKPERVEDNKEVAKIWGKNNYSLNRERLIERHSCLCGGKFTTKNIQTHYKTQKHLEYLDNTESPPPLGLFI